MRTFRISLAVLLALLSVPSAHPQEKESAASAQPQPAAALPQTPLKIQFVLEEYDGAKKIASMPYTMSLTLSHPDRRDSLGSLKAGVRFPVTVSTDRNTTQQQYIDIGTSINCWVWLWSGDRYLLSGDVEESLLAPRNAASESKEKDANLADANPSVEPLIRQTRGSFIVALRDGQPQEAASLTDPITGHVIKVQVTLTVMK